MFITACPWWPASTIIPFPTIIATWPSHTARSPSRSAYGTRGAPSLVYSVAKSVGRVGVRRGRWSTCSYSRASWANICYFFTLAVAWMLVDDTGHRKARCSVGLSNVELRGAHAAPQGLRAPELWVGRPL
jgi:hypothetical protein